MAKKKTTKLLKKDKTQIEKAVRENIRDYEGVFAALAPDSLPGYAVSINHSVAWKDNHLILCIESVYPHSKDPNGYHTIFEEHLLDHVSNTVNYFMFHGLIESVSKTLGISIINVLFGTDGTMDGCPCCAGEPEARLYFIFKDVDVKKVTLD